MRTLVSEGELGTNVPMVMLQFSFSTKHPMPVCFHELPDETDQEHIKRKTEAVPGNQFIIPGENNIDLSQITHDLEQTGYVLVSAARQRRTNNRQPYNMIRFFFILPDYIYQSTDNQSFRSTCRSMLQLIARDAMWRVRAYRNQYFIYGT
ncbi:hypothetical protein IID19_03535, partial [Patescibacteria group bacterium]|nr:hypothetical protein [Patescibacteria group bacterium]